MEFLDAFCVLCSVVTLMYSLNDILKRDYHFVNIKFVPWILALISYCIGRIN